jgi:hypothetical protein
MNELLKKDINLLNYLKIWVMLITLTVNREAEKWYGELLRCLQTLEQNTTIAIINHCELSGNNEKNQILTQLSKIASDEQSRIIFER